MSSPAPPSATTSAICELAPSAARAAQARGAVLIDVREAAECAAGMAEGSIPVPRAQLPARIAEFAADPAQTILLICAVGQRSRTAAAALGELGYLNVASVAGGLSRWQVEGLPMAEDGLDADARERYARQLCLPQVGVAGQRRLAAARVALIGAGGLGSPAALYLAAAGVGRLSLFDDDVVERSNLHRQVLHTDARVGVAKVDSARTALAALNPAIGIDAVRERLNAANAERLLHGHDVVIDGSDNFPTRYLLAAASHRLRLPMIYGAVERFSGQLSVFDPRREDSPCYRCLFPEPPGPNDAPNCSEAGVLGVLPGLVGLMQATEALKLILGIGTPLIGQLLCFDALSMAFHRLHLARDPQCPGCGPDAHTHTLIDLAAPVCSTRP
ncbi:MAG: molybdopterin-synthase adenylyltransferase MoeB [Xanthomonadales bacterium]|nr:molybdopterin-synthase adenylyltransferase MoeB [Xanthomonadales bacterium]